MIHKEQLDPLVEQIVDESIRPSVTISIRDIAREVERRIGYLPSTSVIRYSLDRLKLSSKGKRWMYKHSRGHE